MGLEGGSCSRGSWRWWGWRIPAHLPTRQALPWDQVWESWLLPSEGFPSSAQSFCMSLGRPWEGGVNPVPGACSAYRIHRAWARSVGQPGARPERPGPPPTLSYCLCPSWLPVLPPPLHISFSEHSPPSLLLRGSQGLRKCLVVGDPFPPPLPSTLHSLPSFPLLEAVSLFTSSGTLYASQVRDPQPSPSLASIFVSTEALLHLLGAQLVCTPSCALASDMPLGPLPGLQPLHTVGGPIAPGVPWGLVHSRLKVSAHFQSVPVADGDYMCA